MPWRDLREFVTHLDKHDRLRRVTVPVSRDLEITEITDRVSKSGGGANVALLFERVEGFSTPVLVNAFGSEERMAWALGLERLEELGERLAKLLDLRIPGTFAERLRKLGSLIDVARAAPRKVGDAPCQEVVETADPSVGALPILKCWPGDGGRYITLPAVFTRDPRTGARNVGMYRLQMFDERTLGMHWQTHKGGAEHERLASGRMPVAIALGAAASGHRRGPVRGVAARRRRRDGPLPHDRPGGAGPVRDRARGLGRSGRTAGGRSVRRPHRLLLAGPRVSPLPPHRGHPARPADLSDHHRRPPAPGG